MNKNLLFLFCGLFPTIAFSQIGVNTSSPQQTLHVSGTPTPYATAPTVGTTDLKIIEPTVRIEGLNATNNSTHISNNDNSIERVYVTHQGDLVLKPTKSYEVLVNETSFPTVYSPPYVIDPSTQQSIVKVQTYDFTITSESMVYFTYGMNTRIYRSSDHTEGHYTTTQYFAESYLLFSDASDTGLIANMSHATIPLNRKRFAEDSFQVVNRFNYFTNTNMYLTSNRSMLLQPGTYSVDLYVANSGRTSFSIGTNVPGENQFDFIKVIAIPTNR